MEIKYQCNLCMRLKNIASFNVSHSSEGNTSFQLFMNKPQTEKNISEKTVIF